MDVGLGDAERASQGISNILGETGKVRQQGIGRWGSLPVVNTDWGVRKTVQPMTHTNYPEPQGNLGRAAEREWMQSVPCGASRGDRLKLWCNRTEASRQNDLTDAMRWVT